MMGKTFKDYQDSVSQLAVYPGSGELMGLVYTALGLAGEAGEFADKIKKIIRDKGGKLTKEDALALLKEDGDVLWYVTMVAVELGKLVGEDYDLEMAAQVNEDKLWSRANRGKLQGSGDDR